jgi:hypothetical protein
MAANDVNAHKELIDISLNVEKRRNAITISTIRSALTQAIITVDFVLAWERIQPPFKPKAAPT